MHNLCVLAGIIDVVVETSHDVVVVGITIPQVDGLHMCGPSHGILSGASVGSRNDVRIYGGNGGRRPSLGGGGGGPPAKNFLNFYK